MKTISSVVRVLLGHAAPALAEPLPGIRGVNHIDITVPDWTLPKPSSPTCRACQKATPFGPFRNVEGTLMQDVQDVDPRAVIKQFTLMRCGVGSNIKLFQYSAPDQKTVAARNGDIGGHHIAFCVNDIGAALACVKELGVRTLFGPLPMNQGPAAGQMILSVFAPWRLQLEAISLPQGMALYRNRDRHRNFTVWCAGGSSISASGC